MEMLTWAIQLFIGTVALFLIHLFVLRYERLDIAWQHQDTKVWISKPWRIVLLNTWEMGRALVHLDGLRSRPYVGGIRFTRID